MSDSGKFKDNGDFVCSCGSTIWEPRSCGATAWQCHSCWAIYEQHAPRVCDNCHKPMVYYQWPCVDDGTGDHLGDYMLWRCEPCGITVNVGADA